MADDILRPVVLAGVEQVAGGKQSFQYRMKLSAPISFCLFSLSVRRVAVIEIARGRARAGGRARPPVRRPRWPRPAREVGLVTFAAVGNVEHEVAPLIGRGGHHPVVIAAIRILSLLGIWKLSTPFGSIMSVRSVISALSVPSPCLSPAQNASSRNRKSASTRCALKLPTKCLEWVICRAWSLEQPHEHLADHALAGALQAAEHNGNLGLPAGVLDAVGQPADKPVIVVFAAGADDRAGAPRCGPRPGLGLRRPIRAKVEDVWPGMGLWDQSDPHRSGAGIVQPRVAEPLPDLLPAARSPPCSAGARTAAACRPRARRSAARAETVIIGRLGDPDAAAYRGDEVVLVEFGDAFGQPLLPVVSGSAAGSGSAWAVSGSGSARAWMGNAARMMRGDRLVALGHGEVVPRAAWVRRSAACGRWLLGRGATAVSGYIPAQSVSLLGELS